MAYLNYTHTLSLSSVISFVCLFVCSSFVVVVVVSLIVLSSFCFVVCLLLQKKKKKISPNKHFVICVDKCEPLKILVKRAV